MATNSKADPSLKDRLMSARDAARRAREELGRRMDESRKALTEARRGQTEHGLDVMLGFGIGLAMRIGVDKATTMLVEKYPQLKPARKWVTLVIGLALWAYGSYMTSNKKLAQKWQAAGAAVLATQALDLIQGRLGLTEISIQGVPPGVTPVGLLPAPYSPLAFPPAVEGSDYLEEINLDPRAIASLRLEGVSEEELYLLADGCEMGFVDPVTLALAIQAGKLVAPVAKAGIQKIRSKIKERRKAQQGFGQRVREEKIKTKAEPQRAMPQETIRTLLEAIIKAHGGVPGQEQPTTTVEIEQP